ncbi:hypothetical protein [Nocardia niigatensis]|uniref:hypothetical protein n=1 Tax=Nocardia niigatensis TaxID=209249 RepID=UPI000317A214|nr:hypothetical protein [Nocardia niigatensis]
MSSSLQSLVGAPPSGRSRPLLVDCDAYATAVIRQGAPIPWADISALTGHVAQVHALLDPDTLWVDIEALVAGHLTDDPRLLTQMGARSRTGYPLRTMLGSEALVDRMLITVRTLADATRRPVVLDVPSPARWLGRVHTLAGNPLSEVDDDSADSASMYFAEWLGKLGTLPIALVLLDARASEGDTAVTAAETVSSYSSIVNVAGHFGWTLAMRTQHMVEVSADAPGIALVSEQYWLGEAELGAAELGAAGVLLATIPATASPEHVLERHARIG